VRRYIDIMQTHLQRSVDFQIAGTKNADEAASCSNNPETDGIAGKVLCEILHATNST
jgi:hypothetical protein